jgi:hypothetical protein
VGWPRCSCSAPLTTFRAAARNERADWPTPGLRADLAANRHGPHLCYPGKRSPFGDEISSDGADSSSPLTVT